VDYLSLVQKLVDSKILRSPLIIESFRRNRRADFLPEDLKHLAGEDTALPIGFGQTISQPQTVAFMMELLEPRPGDKILDVGTGSGWTSALLSYIVGSKEGGEVWSAERIPELCDFGRENLKKYSYEEKGILKFIRGDASKILTKREYFDKIISGASAGQLPKEWKEELKIGGRIAAPVANSIVLSIKKSADQFEEKEFAGFVFVPLVKGE